MLTDTDGIEALSVPTIYIDSQVITILQFTNLIDISYFQVGFLNRISRYTLPLIEFKSHDKISNLTKNLYKRCRK